MKTPTRLIPVVSWTFLAALISACGAGEPPPAAGVSPEPSGQAAVWFLEPGQNLQASSTGFTALVSRLDCNGGVTGQVLAPQIRVSGSEIVVTFAVAPRQPGPASCPGNKQVPYEVDLGTALQGRSLVDGQCLPGAEAVTTSHCAPDAVRFKP